MTALREASLGAGLPAPVKVAKAVKCTEAMPTLKHIKRISTLEAQLKSAKGAAEKEGLEPLRIKSK